ncbi:type II secretion system F family protein [Thermobifida halotolerans]|uniref:Type II secretion system F family protein n=1 Tax=Thermobifida halotolerans TaxID=483545 RepID=A0A399FXK8_9ACTN|nr:type II secretion system F family protein [Thermobifida halotolerans]
MLVPYGGALWSVGCLGCAAVWALPSAAELRLRSLTAPLDPRPTVHSLWTALRRRLARRPGRMRGRRLHGCVDVCRTMVAELRCGSTPAAALATAVRDTDPLLAAELADVAALTEAGHDPAPALRSAARLPGASGLAGLAVCWRVAASSGAGLAAVVERLAEGLTQEEALLRELDAQLAGPRATAALLAGLPVLGLLMAGALGGAPLSFLLTTPLGVGCLAAGTALDALGLWWIRRMVDRVARTVQA